MPLRTDSFTTDADGGVGDDTIFTLPAFRVTERPLDSFIDYSGSGNIFDYNLGTIATQPTDVSFGLGTIAPPSSVTQLQPMAVQGVYEQIYNDELARTNAARAKQGLPPLTNVDADEIGRIADFAAGQVTKVYEDAQRDLDRAQAARQIGQTGLPIPLPLPIGTDLANIINAAELAAAVSNVIKGTNLGVDTPQTPQQVVETGGDLSQIGTVNSAPGVTPGVTPGQPSVGLGSIPVIGGVLGGIAAATTGPTGIFGTPSTTSSTSTTDTGMQTTSTTNVVVTPGATGGETRQNAPIDLSPNQARVDVVGVKNRPTGIFDPIDSTTSTVLNTNTSTETGTTQNTTYIPTGTNTLMNPNPNTGTSVNQGTESNTSTYNTSLVGVNTNTVSNVNTNTVTGPGPDTNTSTYKNTVGINTNTVGVDTNTSTRTSTVFTGTAGGNETNTSTYRNTVFTGTVTSNETSQTTSSNTVFTGTNTVSSTSTSTSSGPSGTVNIFTLPQSSYSVMPTTPAQRNILVEGTTTSGAFTQLTPAFSQMYGGLAGGYQAADEARLYGMAAPGSQFAGAQGSLTDLANQQTIASNQALRRSNIADVGALGGEALAYRQTLNPQLYRSLNQMSLMAEQQAGTDFNRVQEGAQLTPEDIRNAQQAAREAYSARGMVMSPGAIGAEILNRQALQQQREQLARQNYQQSLQNLGAATQMQTANVFDPFSTILGQQYGMQSQNVGTTQGLFGQAGALASGGLAYQPVVQTYNPFGVYPADVYGTNVNAVNAAQIAEANRAASLEAARMGQTANYAQTLGTFAGSPTGQTVLKSIWDWFGGTSGGTTRPPGT